MGELYLWCVDDLGSNQECRRDGLGGKEGPLRAHGGSLEDEESTEHAYMKQNRNFTKEEIPVGVNRI